MAKEIEYKENHVSSSYPQSSNYNSKHELTKKKKNWVMEKHKPVKL